MTEQADRKYEEITQNFDLINVKIPSIEEFESIFAISQNQRTNIQWKQIVSFVSNLSFFIKLSNQYGTEMMFKLCYFGNLVYFKKKQVIIHQKKALPGLLVLIKGSISSSSSDQKINIGEALCENEVFNDDLSPYNYISVIPSLMFFVENIDFQSLSSKHQKQVSAIQTVSRFFLRRQTTSLQFIKRVLSKDEIRNYLINYFSFFSLIAKFDFEFILGKVEVQSKSLNEVLFKQNEPIQKLYFILEGEFQISEYYLDGRRLRPICIVGKGNTIGFPDILSYSNFQNTMQCFSKTGLVCAIGKNDFLLKVNAIFNVEAFNSMMKQYHLKKTSNYSSQKKQEENQYYDQYNELNKSMDTFINRFTGKAIIK